MSSLQQAFVNQTHPPRLLAYGFQFGPNSPPIENIETVTSEHIFLFRVHHPQSHVQYDERFGFVAGKYKYGYTMGQAQLDYMSIVQDRPRFSDLVRRHVLNEGNTPFVSTTFNLAWALARAASICQKRRVNARDVLIAVIHAAFISRGSFFALEFLHDEQQMDSDKVRRWANADQEVLVPLHITASAIAACVSQEALELNMYAIPRWFLTEHGTLDNQNLTSREFMARARQRFTTLQVLPMDAIGDAYDIPRSIHTSDRHRLRNCTVARIGIVLALE
ncbi:hypothetical protein BD410DRAFT_195961 [Rickenella mellea]|uniref:DUF7587 domain-containing protein n=1 Tax=Rickenella mellea TaxID=50990 RepID=A0A4Y7Q5Z7_9AGAM|nr:hypothetical protein BD410DRAFT_195961 [Rickenella mellea]